MQLTDRPTSELQHLGNSCLHFTWKSRGTVSLEGLELQVSRLLIRFAIAAHGMRHDFLVQKLQKIDRYVELILTSFPGTHVKK